MDKNIATLLREIKSASGMSELQMAAKLKISQPTVNRILNGQDDCKGSTLRAIEDLHATTCSPAHRNPDNSSTVHAVRILPSSKNIMGFGLDGFSPES